jgi:hypothetical protein
VVQVFDALQGTVCSLTLGAEKADQGEEEQGKKGDWGLHGCVPLFVRKYPEPALPL